MPRSRSKFSMEGTRSQNPNLESSNSLQQMVAVETLLNLVERVTKFHYLQTFAGDVVKVDTRKDNHARQLKQCAGIVPSKDTLRKSA